MRVVVGVDGGGSSTLAVAARLNGTVVGIGRAGPVNLQAVSEQEAAKALKDSVAAALAPAGAGAAEVVAACFGLAGAGRAADAAAYTRIIGELRLAQTFEVVTDCEIALDAATTGGPGAVLICGTGSVCFGRDASGAWIRAGGWGPVIGDEGSGYEIGRRALNACARAHDGLGPPTALTDAVLRRTGAACVADLPVAVRTDFGRAEIASLARCVLDAAYGLGDGVARDIARKAAQDLAEAVEIVARRLGPDAPVTLAGGLFENEPRFVEEVTCALQARLPGITARLPELPAVAGALWRAARAARSPDFDMSALAMLRKGAANAAENRAGTPR